MLPTDPTELEDTGSFQPPTYTTLPRSIPACFEGIVQTYPDRLALVTDTTTWTYDLTDDEILARLLALNLARAAHQTALPLPPTDPDAGET